MVWMVAKVRAGAELALAARLIEETYVPVYERNIRIRGKKSRRRVSAWPGYLLIRDPGHIDDSRFYRFLMVDDERAILSDAEVDWWKMAERLGAFQKREEVKRLLGIGDAVKVAVEAWHSRVGYVLNMSNGLVRIGGGDFPKPVRIPLALLLPESGVK